MTTVELINAKTLSRGVNLIRYRQR